jgi:hypothetical protein
MQHSLIWRDKTNRISLGTNQEYAGRGIYVQSMAAVLFWTSTQSSFHIAGRRRAGPADRVRQHRKLTTGKVDEPFARNRNPKCDGSKSRAHHPPDADRKCCPWVYWVAGSDC